MVPDACGPTPLELMTRTAETYGMSARTPLGMRSSLRQICTSTHTLGDLRCRMPSTVHGLLDPLGLSAALSTEDSAYRRRRHFVHSATVTSLEFIRLLAPLSPRHRSSNARDHLPFTQC